MQQNNTTPNLLTMQIIAGALISGMVIFAVIAAVMGMNKQPGEPFLTYIAGGFAAVILVPWVILPGTIASAGRKNISSGNQSDEAATKELMGVYQTMLIIRLALLEGAAFFNLVTYMMETRWWSYIAVGILLLLMLSLFPTRSKLDRWIEDQKQLIELQ